MDGLATNFGTYDDPIILKVIDAVLPVSSLNREDEIKREGQRVAAIMVPLVFRKDHWRMILTQRPETMPSHAGQVAFPGGKREFGETTLDAALRETEEEIGVARHHMTVIGRLLSFSTGTQFRITPFISLIDPEAEIKPDPHEVDAVFEVPMSFLMNPDNHIRRLMPFKGEDVEVYEMPYTDDSGVYRYIWGMTANTIRRIYERGFEHAQED